MSQNKILVASPGTGKTTRLLDLVSDLLRQGVRPEAICFTTYTKAGADEARDRAIKRFPEYKPEQFQYFRTLHSIAYRALGTPDLVDNDKDFFRELVKATGVPCSLTPRITDSPDLRFLGDIYLHLYNIMRNRMQTIPQLLLTQHQICQHLNINGLQDYIKKYTELKRAYRVYDYTDLLERFIEIQDDLVPISHLFVDEAQDLTLLQWRVIAKLSEDVATFTVAGDDKQSIYEWAGASPETLIQLEGDREILNQSFRLKDALVRLSEKIAAQIKVKSKYEIKPVSDGGETRAIRSLDQIDMKEGSWLLLARLNRDLEIYRLYCEKLGYKYVVGNDDVKEPVYRAISSWEALRGGQWLPAEEVKGVLPYLRTGPDIKKGYKAILGEIPSRQSMCLNDLITNYGVLTDKPWDCVFHLDPSELASFKKTIESEGLTSQPRIRIATIHGAKGMEADNVVLIPRLSMACRDTLITNPDAEHRVFYVGVTRAKNRLFVLKGDTEEYSIL